MRFIFNIFTKLKDKIREMLIKTLKNVEERFLKYFYIEIYFSNPETKNQYKLPVILHMVDTDEALLVQQHILKAIIRENLTIEVVKKIKKILPNKLEETKTIIAGTQKINGFETINLILEKPELESTELKNDINYRLKINTIKKGEIPLRAAGDLFVFKIDKSILED